MKTDNAQSRPHLGRRAVLAACLALGTRRARAAPPALVRLGILPFGSVQWVADVITHHQLDEANGFRLQTLKLASTEAAKVALLGGAVDVAVSDWPFVAELRRRGGHLCFAAGNNGSLGGVMVAASSPVRSLADLKGLRLGVAGGAADKSWLLVQAAARRQGIDLAHQATLSFGAPPLLDAMLRHNDLDASLTFWNYAARLEAAGFREAVSVADCGRASGLASTPILVGYVFDDRWAASNRQTIDGFLKASAAAANLLATSRSEWDRVRPLMNMPSDAESDNLRRRFIDGLNRPSSAAMQSQATQIETLLASGTARSSAVALPAGVFWQGANAG